VCSSDLIQIVLIRRGGGVVHRYWQKMAPPAKIDCSPPEELNW
jgi:hypothetical protein